MPPARPPGAPSRTPPNDVVGHRLLALLWLVVVAVAAYVSARGAVDTDLFALLPTSDSVFLTRALRGGEQQITLLIRDDAQGAVSTTPAAKPSRAPPRSPLDAAPGNAERAAAAFVVSLRHSGVISLPNSAPAALIATVLPYRYQLLAAEDRRAFSSTNASENIAQLQTRALELIGGPEALGRLTPAALDPLGTLERFLRERLAILAPRSVPNESAVVLHAHVTGSPFDLSVQSAVETDLALASTAMHKVVPSARLLRAGAIFHATANADAARRQTNLVGAIASVGVLVLAFWVFRQLRPLVLVMVPVAVGGVVAFGVAFMLFPSLHVITLIFGATLIGLASDYAFHFLVARDGNDHKMAQRLAPTLFSSAACTALAYSCLALAGMRALTEVAVIGAIGLLAAAVTVVLWFPLLCRGLPVRIQPLPALGRWLRSLDKSVGTAAVVVLGVLSAGILLGRAVLVADARALDGTPNSVRAETAAVVAATGGIDGGSFVLLQARDGEALLELEERVRPRLDRLVTTGQLGGYLATSSLVPSQARQAEDFSILQTLWKPRGVAEQFVQSIGAQQWFVAWRQSAPLAPLQDLQPERLGAAVNSLWLGRDHGVFAAVIRLSGIADRPALQRALDGASAVAASVDLAKDKSAQVDLLKPELRNADLNKIELVEVAQRLSGLFQRLAEWAAFALLLAFGAVALGLAIWQRAARTLLGMLPIAVAVAVALACSALLNPALNLFHMFGAFLVLGVGTDSVVVQLNEDDEPTTLGIIVSQLTTSLTFATLMLVDLPAVRVLGMVVAIGTMVSVLLSILFRRSYRRAADVSIPA